ncbi:hypothetical protein SDC9_169543 [bioreactor metagenome]|uniref:Uncharacterized protein n=1 Tax=bioreactor metagenome TaxID=1076179 RepID=A0A645G845_9ZZZZ
MAADLSQLVKIRLAVGRRKNVVFLPHFLASQTCFVKPARRRPAEVLPHQRVKFIERERLLRQQNFTAGVLHDALQNLQVLSDQRLIHHKAGRWQIFKAHLSPPVSD